MNAIETTGTWATVAVLALGLITIFVKAWFGSRAERKEEDKKREQDKQKDIGDALGSGDPSAVNELLNKPH